MSEILKMKGVKQVVKRLLNAVRDKEKIILIGDSDPDGVTSIIILKEALDALGSHTQAYFPNPEEEGHGLKKELLESIKDEAPALLITLDFGIRNFEEIELANTLGFEVIVIDHHLVLDQLPKASIIIDPYQKGDGYPFKKLANAGIVYQLAKELLVQTGKQYYLGDLLALTMLATLAEQVPLEQDNAKIVEEGLIALQYSQRPGLLALVEIANLENCRTEEIREKIIPLLSSAETQNHQSEMFTLLVEKSEKEAEKMVQILLDKNEERKTVIQRTLTKIDEEINPTEIMVFSVLENLPSLPILGTLASKIQQKYDKPSLIIRKDKLESRGSMRTPEGVNSLKALEHCQEFLKNFGGHSPASGFSLENNNLEKLKTCLLDYFQKQ